MMHSIINITNPIVMALRIGMRLASVTWYMKYSGSMFELSKPSAPIESTTIPYEAFPTGESKKLKSIRMNVRRLALCMTGAE